MLVHMTGLTLLQLHDNIILSVELHESVAQG